MKIFRLFCALCLFSFAATVVASEIKVTTADGQTLQGENLGVKDGVLKLKSKFGVVSIAEKDIVTITAIRSEKPVEKPPAETLPTSFPQPRQPNVTALVAQALVATPPKEPTKEQRQELIRYIRNYSESMPSSRARIIKSLQRFGLIAQPFITPAYTDPWALEERIDLFEALAVPGQALSAGAFVELHGAARKALESSADEPPPPPPDYVSLHDRQRPKTKAEWLKVAAGGVVRVEGYAATTGGPYNTLFLLDLYRKRYGSDKENALLINLKRDSTRLASAASDASRGKSGWSADARILVAEQTFPLLFREPPETQELAQALLKKVLPSGYPAWDAPQAEWVEWWFKAREELQSKR